MYLLTYAPALCGHGDGARHGGLDAAGALGQHGDGGLHARHAAEGVRPLALRPGELLPQASTPLEAGTGLGLVSRDQRRLRRRIRLARARGAWWCVGACVGRAGGGSEWWLERSKARGGGGEGAGGEGAGGGEPAPCHSPAGLRRPWRTAAPPCTTRDLSRLPPGPSRTPLPLHAPLC